MSNNLKWNSDDLKKKGLVQNADGVFVPVSSLVAKGRVSKIDVKAKLKEMGFWQPPTSFPVTPNAKVRNATKVEENGVKFDSRLEKYMYDLLVGAKVTFEFQKIYLLQEKFRYRDEAVMAITLTVDFWLPTKDIIIDAKGFANDVSPLKYKMLKNLLKHRERVMPDIIMPATKKECDLLLNRILYEK